ncbi:glycosyltransferase [Leucobacter chromiireducens]|uniref:glycosyltransferase n=1 Tax=Leucobacter chromiireducens TaxID=283877 RepID=UPI003F81A535
MRYVLAIATLALSGVLLILGLGQRTFLAGPAEISFPVDTKSETAYAVIDGADFAKVPGQANVVVKGENAFVATGATRDVRGWVEPFSHAELSVDTNGKKLLSALIAPAIDAAPADDATTSEAEAAKTGLDPRGSDLWLEERVIDEAGTGAETETLRVPVALTADQSVLIASDGSQPVPKDVSLVWAQDRNTPWAGPLLAAGGVLAILGGLQYLLAVDHDRRGLGPRRGRKGPLQGIRNAFSRGGRGESAESQTSTPAADRDREAPSQPAADGGVAPDAAPASAPEPASQPEQSNAKPGDTAQRSAAPSRLRSLRRSALPVIGLTAALGLSGCSASYWPQFDQPAATEEAPAPTASAVAPVPVTEGQLQRIVQRVSETAGLSDDELDATLLAERFTGDALAQRTANYKIRAKQADYAVLPPRLTDQELDYQLVQSTEGWPRTLFVTVASTAGGAQAPADGEDAAADAPASPSLALVLTQQTPHENYLVSRVIALRGGISMPQAAPAEDGTALLSNDIETLTLAPAKVGEAYAALLQNGKDAEQAEFFDLETDTLLDSYGKARAAEAQSASDGKGQTMRFSVQAKQGDSKPIALSTGAGGALVATTVIEEQIVDAAGGRYKPQAKDAVTALSGLTGEQDKLIQEVAHQMLFYVPSKTAGTKIELLGVTSELVGVRN